MLLFGRADPCAERLGAFQFDDAYGWQAAQCRLLAPGSRWGEVGEVSHFGSHDCPDPVNRGFHVGDARLGGVRIFGHRHQKST